MLKLWRNGECRDDFRGLARVGSARYAVTKNWQGDSRTLRLAPEALAFHIEGMLEDGAELPEASPADDVVKERAGELLTMVNVRDPRPRERINISLTAGQVAKIDRAAARNGMSRSAFVVAAALGLKKKGKRLTS
jgi:HicB_like antitoxin of bacterial toxin-antitoxin system